MINLKKKHYGTYACLTELEIWQDIYSNIINPTQSSESVAPKKKKWFKVCAGKHVCNICR